MTIAIGLLCNAGYDILLAADTMISYGVESSNPSGSKLYRFDNGLHVAVADDMAWTHAIARSLEDSVGSTKKDDPKFAQKIRAALRHSSKTAFQLWREDVLRRVHITLDEYLHDSNLSKEKRREAEDELWTARGEGLPIEMIVVGFGGGQRVWMYTDGWGTIREETSPGIFVAGSGKTAALDWLNFRGQSFGNSWEKSYYHLLEAMQFAKISRHVGESKAVIHLSQEGQNFLFRGEHNQDNERVMAKLLDEYSTHPTPSEFPDEVRKAICEANAIPFRPVRVN